MDTWQIAEKLFNFCEGRYPDLKWIFHKLDYDQYNQTIQGVTDLTDSPEIEMLLKVGDGGSVDEYSEYSEGLYVKIGVGALNSLDWVGEFIVLNENQIAFNYIRNSKSDYFDNKYRETRKVMLDIFTFILDEIQE